MKWGALLKYRRWRPKWPKVARSRIKTCCSWELHVFQCLHPFHPTGCWGYAKMTTCCQVPVLKTPTSPVQTDNQSHPPHTEMGTWKPKSLMQNLNDKIQIPFHYRFSLCKMTWYTVCCLEGGESFLLKEKHLWFRPALKPSNHKQLYLCSLTLKRLLKNKQTSSHQ